MASTQPGKLCASPGKFTKGEGIVWRAVSGGQRVEGCGWRAVGGGKWVEESGWRGVGGEERGCCSHFRNRVSLVYFFRTYIFKCSRNVNRMIKL